MTLCRSKLRCCLLLGCCWAALLTRGWAVAEDSDAGPGQAVLNAAELSERLERLAEICERVGLSEQAAVTRRWQFARDPERQYLFLPPRVDPHQPAADAPRLVRQWYRKFREYRAQRAAALYAEARNSAEAGDEAAAYRLLHEVLRQDPDHADARRVLGYRHVASGWQRPVRVGRARAGVTSHPQFGWPRGRYWRVDTQHFRVLTDLTPEAGEQLAASLEQLHAVWQQVFYELWSPDGVLQARLQNSAAAWPELTQHEVVLFRDREEYVRQLTPVEPQIGMSLGYYMDGQNTVYFYGGDNSVQPTWWHEATHQLLQELPGRTPQLGRRGNFWVIEGVALYLESLQYHDGYATVGGFDSDRLQFARYRALNENYYVPLEQFVAYDRERLQGDENIRRLYSQAAGLAHFLMDFDGGRHRPALLEYLQLVYEGNDGSDTLMRLAGVSAGELDAQYREFLNVTDADMQYLGPLPELHNLCLGHTAVTDQGLTPLTDARQLEWLDLAYTKTSDATVSRFGVLEKLRQLNLEGTQITDVSLPMLARLPALEELDLSHTAVTDAGLKWLAKLRDLQVLWLTGTRISDDGLALLEPLRQLRTLDVSQTRVTADAWSALRAKLPQLAQ